MGQNVDLLQEFDDWLNELQGFSFRSDRLHDDLSNIAHNPLMTSAHRMELATKWLKYAYLAGARRMAQDTLDTLGDYGTAVAGIDQPQRNPTEGYDAARESLMVYYTKVLDNAVKITKE